MTGIYLGLIFVFILAFPNIVLGSVVALIAFLFGASF